MSSASNKKLRIQQKTSYDISIFKEFISAYYSTEYREIKDDLPSEQQPIFKKFVLAVRKKDVKTVNVHIINRKLHGSSKIRILCSRVKNNISLIRHST